MLCQPSFGPYTAWPLHASRANEPRGADAVSSMPHRRPPHEWGLCSTSRHLWARHESWQSSSRAFKDLNRSLKALVFVSRTRYRLVLDDNHEGLPCPPGGRYAGGVYEINALYLARTIENLRVLLLRGRDRLLYLPIEDGLLNRSDPGTILIVE